MQSTSTQPVRHVSLLFSSMLELAAFTDRLICFLFVLFALFLLKAAVCWWQKNTSRHAIFHAKEILLLDIKNESQSNSKYSIFIFNNIFKVMETDTLKVIYFALLYCLVRIKISERKPLLMIIPIKYQKTISVRMLKSKKKIYKKRRKKYPPSRPQHFEEVSCEVSHFILLKSFPKFKQ